MADVSTILIRMPNWLGDCVMAMPALRQATESFPGARIYLAGREHFRQFLAAQPGVAGFVAAPASGFGNLIRDMPETKRLVREAGIGQEIDLGILFTNSLSTAAWMWRTGARQRIGYNLDCRWFFLTHPVPYGTVEVSRHFIHYYRWLVHQAETAMRPTAHADLSADIPVPHIQIDETSRDRAACMVRAAGLDDRYAVIAPASAYGAVKDWPPEYYRELVARIVREDDCPVVVTGAKAQQDIADAIAAGIPGVISLAGRTDLDCFAGLLAGASLFVGGDSGGAHVAAALGIPTVVIFGITNPTRTRPTGHRVVITGSGEDRDVKLSTPGAREAAKQALRGISPEVVYGSVRKAMGGVET